MDQMIQDITSFTTNLVQTPSQNHLNSEAAVAQLVLDRLKTFGFSPNLIGPDGHPSVTCFIKKPNATKTIWFQTCLDTVPAGDPTKWDYPPFDAQVVGNKMYGRGTADSKVAIAIFCYLAKKLAEDKTFNTSIFLGFDADEQTGVFTGVREIVKNPPKADICILGYQGINEISIGARGWLRLKLTTHGKAAHTGSRSSKGINAIHAMSKAITAITSLDLGQQTQPFFEFGSTLNVAQINGGVAINIVPDKCEANIDIRLLPSQTKDAVMSAITGALDQLKTQDQNFSYEIEVVQYEQAYLTDPEDKFVKLLQTTAQQVLGKEVKLVASGQGSVGNVISKLGVPVINAFGVDSSNVHAPNEWINIETIPQVMEIYEKALRAYVSQT